MDTSITQARLPDRDPDLLQELREHIEAARRAAFKPRSPASRFGRGDFEERPWRGKDTLIHGRSHVL